MSQEMVATRLPGSRTTLGGPRALDVALRVAGELAVTAGEEQGDGVVSMLGAEGDVRPDPGLVEPVHGFLQP